MKNQKKKKKEKSFRQLRNLFNGKTKEIKAFITVNLNFAQQKDIKTLFQQSKKKFRLQFHKNY